MTSVINSFEGSHIVNSNYFEDITVAIFTFNFDNFVIPSEVDIFIDCPYLSTEDFDVIAKYKINGETSDDLPVSIHDFSCLLADMSSNPLLTSNTDVELKIKCIKVTNEFYPVLDWNELCQYFITTNDSKLLSDISKQLLKRPHISLKSHEKISSWNTSTIHFNNHDDNVSHIPLKEIVTSKYERIKGYKFQLNNYNFIPEDFILLNRSDNDALNKKFDKIAALIAILYLSNSYKKSSSLSESLDFVVVFEGHRRVEIVIHPDNIDDKIAKMLIEIYMWVFDSTVISDKLNLTQMIIPLNISSQSNINELCTNTYAAILSSHELYLRENVKSYIEVKNALITSILSLRSTGDQKIENQIATMKTALTSCTTFFISIAVINAVQEKGLIRFVTPDTAVIMIFLILASFGLLIWSAFDRDIGINNVAADYNLIKSHYDNLLNESDMNDIFEKIDQSKKIKELKTRSNNLFLLWGIINILLLLVVLILYTINTATHIGDFPTYVWNNIWNAFN